jgi:hypothetical protein|tara:strand:- start:252 stop:848 length:597 start_codon:yes stop_codon:yes gene_type:complete
MKKFLGILVLGYLLVGCATTERIKVSLDEIPRIEKDDYIIIAFEGYDSEKIYEAEIDSYAKVEKIILGHCNKKGKKAYYTTHYMDTVKYSYGSGLTAKGQRFWCAKTEEVATELYRNYLKNPPDEYLSRNQIYFTKKSMYWLKNNRIDRIEEKLNSMIYAAKITEYSPGYSLISLIKPKKIEKKKDEKVKEKQTEQQF